MINLNLIDDQLELMMEILATHHSVLFLKGADSTHVERLTGEFIDGLVRIGKKHIFLKFYKEFKGKK